MSELALEALDITRAEATLVRRIGESVELFLSACFGLFPSLLNLNLTEFFVLGDN